MLLTGGTLAQLIFWTILLAWLALSADTITVMQLCCCCCCCCRRRLASLFPCALQFAFKHPQLPARPSPGSRERASRTGMCVLGGTTPHGHLRKKKRRAKVLADKASTAPALPERQQESSPAGQGGGPRHWFGFFLAKSNPPWHLGHGHTRGGGRG